MKSKILLCFLAVFLTCGPLAALTKSFIPKTQGSKQQVTPIVSAQSTLSDFDTFADKLKQLEADLRKNKTGLPQIALSIYGATEDLKKEEATLIKLKASVKPTEEKIKKAKAAKSKQVTQQTAEEKSLIAQLGALEKQLTSDQDKIRTSQSIIDSLASSAKQQPNIIGNELATRHQQANELVSLLESTKRDAAKKIEGIAAQTNELQAQLDEAIKIIENHITALQALTNQFPTIDPTMIQPLQDAITKMTQSLTTQKNSLNEKITNILQPQKSAYQTSPLLAHLEVDDLDLDEDIEIETNK